MAQTEKFCCKKSKKMKKVIYVNDLCCQRCADQMAVKISLIDGVDKAKADFKKNRIFIEVKESVSDEDLRAVFDGMGMEVLSIEKRKGIFG